MCALVDALLLPVPLPPHSSSSYSSTSFSSHTGAVSQMPAAVCQLSAVSSEREDSEGYLKWKGSYITLWCHTLEPINQRRRVQVNQL